MTKSKITALVASLLIVVGLVVQVGCASSGNKKPIIYVDQGNVIPADIPSQFVERYRRFITNKERKEFEKLITDEERQVFIEDFWAKRDSDPSTPENEYKQRIDQRIEDIANERFFGTQGSGGLLFRSNGRFQGDMARVYLLHGEPDAMDVIDGHTFVPLMLWVYVNPENGKLLYAFMFYQKGGSGEFQLFYQDSYKMDQCGAIYEVAAMRTYNYAGGMRTCPDDLYDVYNELVRSNGKDGILDGSIFAWALFNFSSDSDLRLEQALGPPKPASEIARESKSRVVGEAPELTGKAGTDYILSSCEECSSMIPADLYVDERFVTLSGLAKNFDWEVKGENLEFLLKYKIVIQNQYAGKPIVLEDTVLVSMKKSSLDNYPETSVVAVDIIDFDNHEQPITIPPGTYRVSVYVKNTLTQKYNAWSKEITK